MRAFVESIRSASEIREQSEAKKLKAALKHQEKRYAELDIRENTIKAGCPAFTAKSHYY